MRGQLWSGTAHDRRGSGTRTPPQPAAHTEAHRGQQNTAHSPGAGRAGSAWAKNNPGAGHSFPAQQQRPRRHGRGPCCRSPGAVPVISDKSDKKDTPTRAHTGAHAHAHEAPRRAALAALSLWEAGAEAETPPQPAAPTEAHRGQQTRTQPGAGQPLSAMFGC